ncbi:hypothetical protein [uncultured Flavobacterium sp.]|uniref:hypothetical protein n=1 Tax=uncultured Flavobacterium sp. TaxID=165435 RepID=UPI0025FE2E5E|nr:hypothetical protein [uncultured Flavobacterium sp.]
MALINEIFDLCNKLAQNGWREMILSVTNGQLDIRQDAAEKLRSALLEPLTNIDREFPGFEDYTREDNKGIAPGRPAGSLLYHSLASPNVLWEDKQADRRLGYFPSIEEIELIENYVFSIVTPSLSLLMSEADENEIAIVVFASQYRTAVDTPHQRHADLVFSRTGISRVGNDGMLYNPALRGFEALVESDAHKIRVLPCKYSAYLAIKAKGSESFLGKRMRKDTSTDAVGNVPTDDKLDFWVPVHKLFNGKECIHNRDIAIKYESGFKNEKIKKVHKFLKNAFSLETGQPTSSLEKEPFILHDNIAEFDSLKSLVIPFTHHKLVDEANSSGRMVTLQKPKLPVTADGNRLKLLQSSLEIRSREANGGNGSRPAPEYMHIRSKIVQDETADLNLEADIINKVSADYQALHYIDFTGDGFVRAKVTGLSEVVKNILAYAIVAAPDFFPFVEQSEMLNKTLGQRGIWAVSPLALSDTRLSPNINSHPDLKANGLNTFDTVTSLVTISRSVRAQTNFKDGTKENRISYLTDGGAGIFAPGWDTGWDVNVFEGKTIRHLAAYGLGSPFPEDSKLCAALSSFWPAVAPDISRSFWPTSITVLPLTDGEIGANTNKPGWDGEHGPSYDRDGKKVIFKNISYVDYTLNAFHSKFNFHALKSIDGEEYLNRVLTYFRLKSIDRRIESTNQQGIKIKVLELVSFSKVDGMDTDIAEANDILPRPLSSPVLKFIFILPKAGIKAVGIDAIEIDVAEEIIYLVDKNGSIVVKNGAASWKLPHE